MSSRINLNPTDGKGIVAINGVDRLQLNADGSLELLTPAANPTGNDVPTAGQLPFIKSYTSPEQTIATGGLHTLAHGLGATPTLYRLSVVCKTAEHGYSIGDVLEVPHFMDISDSDSTVRGVSLVGNTTNVSIRYVANTVVWSILHKATGTPVMLTPANWRLIVRAWA